MLFFAFFIGMWGFQDRFLAFLTFVNESVNIKALADIWPWLYGSHMIFLLVIEIAFDLYFIECPLVLANIKHILSC